MICKAKDSATKEAATAALQKATFDSASLQLLYIAYLKKYEKDSTEYETINEKIATAINAVKDSSTISFVKENYISGTVNVPELKAGMLNMLAKQQTLPAITLLKQLLLQSPPVTGKINSIIYQLSDSMLLCKTIFPEATRFFGDSLLGAGTIQLVAKTHRQQPFAKRYFTAKPGRYFSYRCHSIGKREKRQLLLHE